MNHKEVLFVAKLDSNTLFHHVVPVLLENNGSVHGMNEKQNDVSINVGTNDDKE